MADDSGLLDVSIPDGLPDLPDLDDPILNSDDFDAPIDAEFPSGSSNSFVARLNCCKCRNPIAAFLHLFFKIASLLLFVILSISSTSYVVTFVVIICCLAFDFWVVKNVSGRLFVVLLFPLTLFLPYSRLVGLMWWNDTNEEGVSEWRFLKQEDRTKIDPIDSLIFWIGLLGYPLLWIGMAVLCFILLKFGYLLMPIFAVVFSAPNVSGFVWCQKDGSMDLKKLISSKVMEVGTKVLVSSATSRLFGGGGEGEA